MVSSSSDQSSTSQRPAERFQPVADGRPKPALKPAPPTVISDRVLGARTDLELRTVLNEHRHKTVVVNFGSAFCNHCKEMLPHFLTASRRYAKPKFVIASLDYMHVETEGIVYTPTIAVYKRGKKVDSFYGSDAQRLQDHLWLHDDG